MKNIKKLLGELPQPKDKRDYKVSESAGRIKEVDLYPYVLFVRNQKYADCVFNSINSQIEIEYQLTYGKKIEVKDVLGLSVGEIYSKARIYNNTFPRNTGYIPRLAYKIYQKFGVVPEYFMPYKTYRINTKPKTIHKFIDGFIKIKRYEFVDIDEIPYVLSLGKPIRIGVSVDRAFMNANSSNPYIKEHEGSDLGGHSVLLIGQKFDTEGNIWFKLLNSWSYAWGFRGYAWVSYKWLKQQYISDGNIIYV